MFDEVDFNSSRVRALLGEQGPVNTSSGEGLKVYKHCWNIMIDQNSSWHVYGDFDHTTQEFPNEESVIKFVIDAAKQARMEEAIG